MHIARKGEIDVAGFNLCADVSGKDLAAALGHGRYFKPTVMQMLPDDHAASAVQPSNLVQTEAFKIERRSEVILR